MRVKKFACYPKLVKKLKERVERNFKFPCSLNLLCISTNAVITDDTKLPSIIQSILHKYSSQKLVGSLSYKHEKLSVLKSGSQSFKYVYECQY